MKKLIFILFVSMGFFFSCSTNNNEVIVPFEEPNIFEKMVFDNVYPVSELSSEAIESFTAKLKFNEDRKVTSGYYRLVEEELNEEEFQLFFNLLFGQEVVLVDIENEREVNIEQYRNCGIVVRRHYEMNGSCKLWDFHFCNFCFGEPEQ